MTQWSPSRRTSSSTPGGARRERERYAATRPPVEPPPSTTTPLSQAPPQGEAPTSGGRACAPARRWRAVEKFRDGVTPRRRPEPLKDVPAALGARRQKPMTAKDFAKMKHVEFKKHLAIPRGTASTGLLHQHVAAPAPEDDGFRVGINKGRLVQMQDGRGDAAAARPSDTFEWCGVVQGEAAAGRGGATRRRRAGGGRAAAPGHCGAGRPPTSGPPSPTTWAPGAPAPAPLTPCSRPGRLRLQVRGRGSRTGTCSPASMPHARTCATTRARPRLPSRAVSSPTAGDRAALKVGAAEVARRGQAAGRWVGAARPRARSAPAGGLPAAISMGRPHVCASSFVGGAIALAALVGTDNPVGGTASRNRVARSRTVLIPERSHDWKPVELIDVIGRRRAPIRIA